MTENKPEPLSDEEIEFVHRQYKQSQSLKLLRKFGRDLLGWVTVIAGAYFAGKALGIEFMGNLFAGGKP